MDYEDQTTEYKRTWTSKACKEAIAFANSHGGVILVGVDDDGTAVGLQDLDEEYTRITNAIRDSIRPDITMFVKSSVQVRRCCAARCRGRDRQTVLSGRAWNQ